MRGFMARGACFGGDDLVDGRDDVDRTRDLPPNQIDQKENPGVNAGVFLVLFR
jgi:hypothetical protein